MERISKLEAEVSKLHNELMETKQMAQQQEMVLTYMGCLFVQTELVCHFFVRSGFIKSLLLID
jgi:hypothetical protein